MALLTPLADIEALNNLLEVDVISDAARALELLAAASTLVRAETGSAWVDADGNLEWDGATDEKLQLVADALVGVVVASAARAWTNPKSLVSETTGPFTIRRGEEAAYGVYLTAQEKTTITKAVALYRGTTTPSLWTLSTTREETVGLSDLGYVDPRTGTIWAEVTPGGAPLPWLDVGELGP